MDETSRVRLHPATLLCFGTAALFAIGVAGTLAVTVLDVRASEGLQRRGAIIAASLGIVSVLLCAVTCAFCVERDPCNDGRKKTKTESTPRVGPRRVVFM